MEVAELTGKRHDSVLRDIRNILQQGVAAHNFVEGYYKDANQQDRPCFNLTKKGCLILASGYDAVLREKIINRWEELEMNNQSNNFQIPQTFAEALMLAAKQAEQIESQQKQLQEQQPKVLFSDVVAGSRSSCLIGELAKLITQGGYTISQNRLFQWMRDNGYMGKKGENYNIPYQQYVEQGLFELKKGTRSGNDGVMYTTITPKVSGKGQIYFLNKFINAK